VVHRDRLQQFPKSFYEDLYGWLQTTDLDSQISARFLEWTWHLLFSKKHKPLTASAQDALLQPGCKSKPRGKKAHPK
jgi:hypothetical protein